MNLMFLAEDNSGTNILLSVIFIVITIGLGVGIWFLIRRNIRLQKEENDVIVENAITSRAMEDSIRQYIKKVDRFGALTLMYVDIDSFGDLNEVFGKDACDNILKEMAARMLRVLPYKASICKYVNDEFIIFIKDEDNKERIERLASKLNEAIAMPYQVLVGESISITASIGICTYPQAGGNFEDLYTNLQLTTYVSKRDGGNKATDYYASIAEEEQDNMAYYREIKQAIANKEFVLYYQPILNLKDKSLAGAEALMRWNHPTKGVQAPSTFLKILEQSGDIKWVGEWGIESMIKTHNDFADKYPTIPLRFSLNLSTKQLLDTTLANKFIDLMNKNNANPENYMLEISDFMMVEKIAAIKTNIYKLKDYGFKIAVDGFEIDGQSVQAIQKAPIDVIKLGRSFLKDIDNNFMKEKLLQILVKYALDNNKQLICEGIESAEVTKYVKEQSVFYGQGYYFAKPMNQKGFDEYIEQKTYKQLLDDVSKLEDTEMLEGNESDSEEKIGEETASDFLARTVKEHSDNQSEESTDSSDDLILNDEEDNNDDKNDSSSGEDDGSDLLI